jgi:hypothetical protein
MSNAQVNIKFVVDLPNLVYDDGCLSKREVVESQTECWAVGGVEKGIQGRVAPS